MLLYPSPATEPVKSAVGNRRRAEAQLGLEHPASSCNMPQSLALMKEVEEMIITWRILFESEISGWIWPGKRREGAESSKASAHLNTWSGELQT